MNKYGQIQDEIVSLKKHSSLMSSSNNPKIAELSDKTALVQEGISQLSKPFVHTIELYIRHKTKNTVQPAAEPSRTPSKVSCNKTSTEHQTSELVKEMPKQQTPIIIPDNEQIVWSPRRKDKGMLLGDSIFKVINKHGLKDNIEVGYISGAKVQDIRPACTANIFTRL